MGLGLITAGLVFLANPNIHVIDIFPDFIGLWLVCAGLTKLAQINADLMDARGLFFKLSIVELAKTFSMILMYSPDYTRNLLMSFTFGIVECILFTLAVNALFVGVENIGMRYSSSEVLATYTKKKGNVRADVSTKVRTTMITFFYIRTVLSFLPEITELQEDTVPVDYSDFKGLFYGVCVIAGVIIGIVYLRRVVAFFNGCRREAGFIDALGKSYGNFLKINKNYEVSRVMKLVLILYAGAAALTYNPTDDGLIELPLLFCGVVLIVMSLFLAKLNRKAIYAVIPSVVMSVLSVVDFIKKDAFYVDNTKFEDVFHIQDAAEKYSVINNLALVEYILLFGTFVFLTGIIMKTVGAHIPDALSTNSIDLKPNSAELDEIAAIFSKYSNVTTAFMSASLILYGALTKIAVIAGEQAAYIDRDQINVPQIIFSWLSVGANALTAAWLVSAILLLGFARKRIYGCVYNWSVVEKD